MADPIEEEFAHRIKLALKYHGRDRPNSAGVHVRTCVVEGIYISSREGSLKAHVYGESNSSKGWMHGVKGNEFIKLFEESEEGIFCLQGAAQALLPGLRRIQILDDLAGL